MTPTEYCKTVFEDKVAPSNYIRPLLIFLVLAGIVFGTRAGFDYNDMQRDLLEAQEAYAAAEKASAEAEFRSQQVNEFWDLLVLWLRDAQEPRLIVDEKGYIFHSNNLAGEQTGYGKFALRGMNISELVPENLRPMHQAGFSRKRPWGRGEINSLSCSLLAKDGKILPIDLSVQYIQTDYRTVYLTTWKPKE